MAPKKRRLVKAASKKPQDTQRRLDMDDHEESPRSKRLRGRSGEDSAPSLVQVPFDSPSNSRDVMENAEENINDGDKQRAAAGDASMSTPARNVEDEEEQEEQPQLQSRRKTRAGLTPLDQRPGTMIVAEQSEAEPEVIPEKSPEIPEMEVAFCDEVAPVIKTDLTGMELPIWLDTYPAFTTKKITVRSSIGKFGELRKCLDDLGLTERFKQSCFGHFLGMTKGLFAPKLVHNILLRRVICRKKHEVWFNFHGLPLRFSLLEFALMTKLRCSEFPKDEYLEDARAKGKKLWELVAGKDKKKSASSDDILNMIKSKDIKDKNVKFSLCLVWFVHGVLFAKDTRCGVEEDVVCLASRPEEFNKYPWGRKSYELTLSYLVKDFAALGNPESSYSLYGFPWAFMAWVLEAIPAARIRQYPEQKTVPRMLRWLSDKLEKDPEHVFQSVETPEVHPYLVPTPLEMRDVLDGFVPYQDVEDRLIDDVMQKMQGVTMLRKASAEPNTPLERVVHSRGSILNAFSGGADLNLEEIGRLQYSGSAGDLFGYARSRQYTRAAAVVVRREEVGKTGGVREEAGGRIGGGDAGGEAGGRTGDCSCKCPKCKEDNKMLSDKVDAIEKMLVEVRELTKQQVGKRVVFPGRALKSPYTSGRKKVMKRQQLKKVDIYKCAGKKRREALDAFLQEKKEEKTPLCFGHEYNYKDLEGVMSMETSLEDQHVDDILSMMRVRINKYSQYYLKSDVILDLDFVKKLCEAFKAQRATADALAAPLEVLLDTLVFDADMMEYAKGKRPTTGGRNWAGSKRVMSVLKLEVDHYVTLEFLLEDAKILVYDPKKCDISDDAFDTLMQPITRTIPIYIKKCGMFQYLPEEILNKNPWSYERVADLPTAQTLAASGGYALAFIEHLLTKTPWDNLNEESMVALKMKWAVDMFHGRMLP